MKPITDVDELAALLHETYLVEEDYEAFFGKKKPSWYEVDQGTKDDYRNQAKRLLRVTRVARFDRDN